MAAGMSSNCIELNPYLQYFSESPSTLARFIVACIEEVDMPDGDVAKVEGREGEVG